MRTVYVHGVKIGENMLENIVYRVCLVLLSIGSGLIYLTNLI